LLADDFDVVKYRVAAAVNDTVVIALLKRALMSHQTWLYDRQFQVVLTGNKRGGFMASSPTKDLLETCKP